MSGIAHCAAEERSMTTPHDRRDELEARLDALHDTGLLDSPPERAFDRLTELACRLLKTPVALISLVDAERQFFKSSRGLSEPWASRRETPLSHSFCQHVVASDEPFIVNDAREHPLVCDNLAIRDLGVGAYLGVPLLSPNGTAIGAFCAIDGVPRHWSDDDVEVLSELAAIAVSEIAVRLHLRDRIAAEAQLRHSDALKSSVLEVALDCIITVDDESCIVEWNPAAERTFGYPREEAIGRDLADLIIPPEYRKAHHAGMSHYLSTGEGPVLGKRFEIDAVRSDGSRFPVDIAIDAISVEGRPYFTAYLRDIAERRRVEAALRDSEQRLTATYEHAFVGIAEVDTAGRFLRVNEELSNITGYSREELLALSFADLTHPDDLATDQKCFEEQLRGKRGSYTLEKRYIHKSGHALWVGISGSMVYDAAGQPLYGVRVSRDISQRKQAERHQRLLVDELNHRVKNTLATVQAIASQSLRGAQLDPRYRDAFEARLRALASAHDVLTQQRWESADVEEVVRAALGPHDSVDHVRFRISGPRLHIRPKAVLALSLALHELATNATKYGALSAEEGCVEIVWELIATPEGDRFRLHWKEHGGPPVEPRHRTGFGSRLIERGLAAELEGGAELDFQRAGLICRIDAPVSSMIDGSADTGGLPGH